MSSLKRIFLSILNGFAGYLMYIVFNLISLRLGYVATTAQSIGLMGMFFFYLVIDLTGYQNNNHLHEYKDHVILLTGFYIIWACFHSCINYFDPTSSLAQSMPWVSALKGFIEVNAFVVVGHLLSNYFELTCSCEQQTRKAR